jgi:hypothetical protein
MTDIPGVDATNSIDLVWTLRDIKAKRTLLLPVDPGHLRQLIDLGLVDLRDKCSDNYERGPSNS